jgi:alpha-beta hydrolase superfamily lysophospholipase
MTRRRTIEVGAVVWAVVGLAAGLRVLRSVNADARVLVLVACVVGAGAALLASACLSVHRDRVAGALLAASAITPTVFAWALNVPAVLVGAALVIAPTWVLSERRVRPT